MTSVSEFLAKATSQPVHLTVRDLLAVWGFRYRIFDSVGRIERDLAAAGLRCEPPVSYGGMDTLVRVGLATATEPAANEPADASSAEPGAATGDEPLLLPQVSLLVRDVPSATGGITSVHPNDTLEDARYVMVARGFSQLAVMTGPSVLRGAVSWESIARSGNSREHVMVGDVTERFPKVAYADEELLGQIDTVYASGFLFVRGNDDSICGIVTTADLAIEFRDLTTPFFQLGEIERRLRHCIESVFTLEEVRQAIRKPALESVEKMTFWEYYCLLRDENRWQRMRWQLNRAKFASHLNDVRKVRNHIMHFGAEPPTDAQKAQVVEFLNLIRYVDTAP